MFLEAGELEHIPWRKGVWRVRQFRALNIEVVISVVIVIQNAL